MLYYDQLNIVAKHLQSAGNSMECAGRIHQLQAPDPTIDQQDLGKTFTLKELKKRSDWELWRKSRFKMLNSYNEQGMFSAPMTAPTGANIHHMLWRYTLKLCGTRKSRMVCDGSARQGTITLGHTFANSLDAASERLFWAIVAKKGLTAYGADCSNAFAEAPAPKHPFFMRIDEAYRDWWENHLGNPPIPSDCTVVRVQNAIQGHPESPRLWEKLIDKILKSTGMNPTKHEPCLYQGMYHGHYTLFMRQVDDFAIATTSSEAAHGLIAEINKQLRLPIHILGTVTRFNGLDVTQTRSFVKISCSKYLAKLQPTYHWLQDGMLKQANLMLPFQTDTSFLSKITHPNEVVLTESERKQLEDRMGIQYRKAMGEVMFPAVKCRPDVSPHVIILSQFMNNPQEIHYQALKQIMHYLVCTKDEGIYYWRDKPVQTLPNHPLPKLHSDTYDMSQNKHMNSDHIVGFVDSDWATNTRKRTSMTGMIIMYAGGAIGYKSKFQPVIAHSSTEAEFVAACDTAKLILFYRSLMHDVGLEQNDATILFEDNNGALLMANAQQPTRRTRHIEIKHFALLDWVEQDLLILHRIPTSENVADAMTKTLSRTLFYRHYDTYMGRRVPDHCKNSGKCLQPSKTPGRVPNPVHARQSFLKTPAEHGGGTRHT
jgi:KUP system potassium uptake protein